MKTPCINLGSKQEAGITDLVNALQDMLDMASKDNNLSDIIEILKDNDISFE